MVSNKKYILFLIYTFICTILPFTTSAQISFWTENFDGAACILPGNSACDPSLVAWTVVNTGGNGASANRFYVSCRENGLPAGSCGTDCTTNNQTLHIGNVATSAAAGLFCPGGDCGAAYDATGATEVTSKRCESPTIDCSGYGNISVNFDYMEGGQGNTDNATLWYFDGISWAQVNNMAKTATCGFIFVQGQWTNTTVNLPASADNNPNVKIAFRWINNGDGTGSDPSFAVNDISVRYSTVLPIKLKLFEAKLNNEQVAISWITASEINNELFIIERSMNGIDFEPISTISGAGNSNREINYSIIDKNPLKGVSYYRLKQVDFNGEFTFSPIKSIVNEKSFNEFIVYPNPSQGIYNLNYEEVEFNNSWISLFDFTGRKIMVLKISSNNFVLDLSTQPNGIYFIELSCDGVLSRKKIIKQ